ncbi:NYN domain-containing protein [Acidobacteriota bacterium]
MTNSEQKRGIPKDILDEIKSFVQDADEKDIFQYVKRFKSISQGFRLESKNVPAFRKKIISRITPKRVEFNLGMFCPPGSLHQVISRFSIETIDVLFPSLIVVAGEAKFLSSILLDHRKDVRTKALEFLEDRSKIKLPERDDAEKLIMEYLLPSEETLELFDRYREQLDREETEKGSHDPKVDKKEVADLKKELSHHKGLNRDLIFSQKSADKTIEKLESRIEKLQQKEGDLKKRIESENAKKNAAIEERDTLIEQKVDLENTFKEKLHREIKAYQNSRINRWLAECEVIEKEVEGQDPDPDPLIVEAEDALQRQSERDRNMGNRRILHNRIKSLREMVTRIQIARTEALSPHEKLGQVENRIHEEIKHLSGMLGLEDEGNNEFIQHICARINEVEIEDLNNIKKTLDALNDQGILKVEQLITAYKCYTRRMTKEYAAFKVKEKEHQFITDDPLELLWYCLEGGDSLLLLLDGYNIIGRLENVFEKWSADYEAGKFARKDLTHRINANTLKSPNLEITLFFDSPHPEEKVVRQGFKIIFSGGGTGKNRADDKIVQYLKSPEIQDTQKNRILVTDDRELRQRAEHEGAKCVPVAQFAELLGELASN